MPHSQPTSLQTTPCSFVVIIPEQTATEIEQMAAKSTWTQTKATAGPVTTIALGPTLNPPAPTRPVTMVNVTLDGVTATLTSHQMDVSTM